MFRAPNFAEIETFVCQSQLIESIGYDQKQGLQTINHLAAAQAVLQMACGGDLVDSRRIHGILMADVLDDAGEYRKQRCCIMNRRGEVLKELPLPQHLLYLMKKWHEYAEDLLRCTNMSNEDKEYECLLFYYHFLCIHPFSDGNGRTGRLLHNLLRLRLGLSWFNFTVDVHPLYVRKLQEYEVEFRRMFGLYY